MANISKLTINIDALEPIVLTSKSSNMILTSSADAINGTMIRGVLASMYIKKHNLGKQAHEDAGFQRLFLQEGLRYLPANPIIAGRRSDILPMSIMKSKLSADIADTAYTVNTEAGYKGINGYGIIDNGMVYQTEVAKTISLHMARNLENERLSGKSEEGHIYSYEAIKAGQKFASTIIGTREMLQELIKALDLQKSATVYIGRSKYSQYGKCRLSIGNIQEMNLTEKLESAMDDDGYVLLYCTTPYIPHWGMGDTLNAMQEIIDELGEACPEQHFELGSAIFAKTDSIANYVGIWNLRRDEETAIAAGSVFRLKCNGRWSEKAIQALHGIMAGEGARRNQEGYGQLRLWCRTGKLRMAESDISIEAIKPEISPEVQAAVKNILHNRFRRDIRQLAFVNVADKAASLAGKNHLFGRLEKMLENCYRTSPANCKELFQKAVASEIREASPAEKHLRSIRFQGQTLLSILKGERPSPYMHDFSWRQILGDDIEKLANDIGWKLPAGDCSELYHEYWLWFFRHARKQATKEAEQ